MDWLKRARGKPEKACPTCGQRQELVIMPLLRGHHGQIEVFFSNMPVLYCGQSDHPRRFADPDFGARLIDAVFWKKNIALGRPGVWAKVKCLKCDKNLTKESGRIGEVGGVIQIKDLPDFTVRVQGPLVTCPRCKTEQLKATKETGTELSNAFVDAFRRANLKP